MILKQKLNKKSKKFLSALTDLVKGVFGCVTNNATNQRNKDKIWACEKFLKVEFLLATDVDVIFISEQSLLK